MKLTVIIESRRGQSSGVSRGDHGSWLLRRISGGLSESPAGPPQPPGTAWAVKALRLPPTHLRSYFQGGPQVHLDHLYSSSTSDGHSVGRFHTTMASGVLTTMMCSVMKRRMCLGSAENTPLYSFSTSFWVKWVMIVREGAAAASVFG